MAGADPYTLEDAELDIARLIGLADRTSEVITKNDSTDPPNIPAAGLTHYSTAGQHKYASSDGNLYGTGSLRQQVSPRSQTINTTAAATIGGLSAAVAAKAYLVHAVLVLEWNAAAGQPELRLQGPAVSQFDLQHASRQSGAASTANTNSEALAGTGTATGYTVIGGNGAFWNPTAVMTAAGIFFTEEVWFWATFTAAGTLTFQAATTIAIDPWIVFSGFWEVSPM